MTALAWGFAAWTCFGIVGAVVFGAMIRPPEPGDGRFCRNLRFGFLGAGFACAWMAVA